MPRPSLDLPATFLFRTAVPVRITDLNYGGHVGNDKILSLIHEARAQFLHHFGVSEKDLGGVGVIMSDVMIVFRNELFYGDELIVDVTVEDISKVAFALLYKLSRRQQDAETEIARARTGMVCFNYDQKKIAPLPAGLRSRWETALAAG